eukprot:7385488-Pyramimonas_sp.AAC.1
MTWAHLKSLRRQGPDNLAAVLEMVSQGALWPAKRRFAHTRLGAPCCPRCGALEIMSREFWGCPSNSEIPELSEDRDLVAQSADGTHRYPCVWLRGLVPILWAMAWPDLPLSLIHISEPTRPEPI